MNRASSQENYPQEVFQALQRTQLLGEQADMVGSFPFSRFQMRDRCSTNTGFGSQVQRRGMACLQTQRVPVRRVDSRRGRLSLVSRLPPGLQSHDLIRRICRHYRDNVALGQAFSRLATGCSMERMVSIRRCAIFFLVRRMQSSTAIVRFLPSVHLLEWSPVRTVFRQRLLSGYLLVKEGRRFRRFETETAFSALPCKCDAKLFSVDS